MLTPAQLTTLKNDIAANQGTNLAAKNIDAIATYYNSDAPSGVIWRPDVTAKEVVAAIVGAEFIVLTAGQVGLFQIMLASGVIDTTKANVVADFSAIFPVSSGSRTALVAMAQRTPTRLEALFTTALVSSVYGYRLTREDVATAALNLDGSIK